jgi:hypothetical protein
MPVSQLSQTEDVVRPAEAEQPSEPETTTGKGRAKKEALDFVQIARAEPVVYTARGRDSPSDNAYRNR